MHLGVQIVQFLGA